MSIRGYQRAQYKPQVSANNFEKEADRPQRNTKTLIDERFVLQEFEKGEEQFGYLEFPFLLKIPEWL